VAISFKDFASPDSSIANQRWPLGCSHLCDSTHTPISEAEAEVWAAAATELWRWVYGGGKVLPGLFCRRVAEAKLLDQ